MKYQIVFEFPGTDYRSRQYVCSHAGETVLQFAKAVWNGAGGYWPFDQGRGLCREISIEEIATLRKIYPKKSEAADSNKMFLESLDLNSYWSPDYIVSLIFEFAEMVDESVKHKPYASPPPIKIT